MAPIAERVRRQIGPLDRMARATRRVIGEPSEADGPIADCRGNLLSLGRPLPADPR